MIPCCDKSLSRACSEARGRYRSCSARVLQHGSVGMAEGVFVAGGGDWMGVIWESGDVDEQAFVKSATGRLRDHTAARVSTVGCE